MPGRALIIVDVQHDFLPIPGAALPVPWGDLVIPEILAIANKPDLFDYIATTQDWHPPGHSSFDTHGGQFRPHCLADSWGATLQRDIAALNAEHFLKGMGVNDPGFDGMQAHRLIVGDGLTDTLRVRRIAHVVIVGLALEYCVAATALAAAKEFSVSVALRATRPLDKARGYETIQELAAAGVVLV